MHRAHSTNLDIRENIYESDGCWLTAANFSQTTFDVVKVLPVLNGFPSVGFGNRRKLIDCFESRLLTCLIYARLFRKVDERARSTLWHVACRFISSTNCPYSRIYFRSGNVLTNGTIQTFHYVGVIPMYIYPYIYVYIYIGISIYVCVFYILCRDDILNRTTLTNNRFSKRPTK